MTDVSTQRTTNGDEDATLMAAKMNLACVLRLLQFEWEDSVEDVCKSLSQVIEDTEGKLSKRNKEHRDLSKQLMDLFEDLKKPWRIKQNQAVCFDPSKSQELVAITTFKGWQSATVEWLSNYSLFAPSCSRFVRFAAGDSPQQRSAKKNGRQNAVISFLDALWNPVH
jgi:hypothetical protein